MRFFVFASQNKMLQLCIIKNRISLTLKIFINMKKISLHLFLLLFAVQIAMAQATVKSEFRLISDKTTANIGDIITVNIEAKEFKKMEGFQWSIKWKTTDYEFISAQIKNLPFNPQSPNQNEIVKGTLFFSWDYDVQPVNLNDETSIYELKFKVKKGGLVDGICFSSDALIIEVLKTGINGEIVAVQADFIGLGCGFVWTKTAKGDKTISTLGSPTGTKELATFESSAFPNPFSTNFNIKNNLQNADNVIVTVFDMLGNLVLEQKYTSIASEESISINASNLASGQYIYKMKTNNGISAGKIMKN